MDTKTNIKKFVKNHIELVVFIGGMGLFFLSSLAMGILEEKEVKEVNDPNNLEAGTPAQRIVKYIEHEDFQGARVVLQQMKPKELDEDDVNMFTSKKKITAANNKKRAEAEEYEDYLEKISRAQITSLINKGDYSTAASVAKEDGNFGSYVDMAINGLPSYYIKNKQDVILLLMTISFPTQGLNKEWDDSYQYWQNADINSLIANYNSKLEQLMTYAKNSDDKDFVKLVSEYLKPQYKSNSSSVQSPSDYTDVNRIKKEFGIK